jgi:hypothetical protein
MIRRILKRILKGREMNSIPKSYLASIGLLGLAVYQFSIGDYANAMQSLMAALGVFGLRQAIAKVGQ